MCSFTKKLKLLTSLSITTYKLQITIPINIAYNTNKLNITNFSTGVNSEKPTIFLIGPKKKS